MPRTLPWLTLIALPTPPAIAQFRQDELLSTMAVLHIMLKKDLFGLEFASLAVRFNTFGVVGAFREADFDAEIGALWVFEGVDGAECILGCEGLPELFSQSDVDEAGGLRWG